MTVRDAAGHPEPRRVVRFLAGVARPQAPHGPHHVPRRGLRLFSLPRPLTPGRWTLATSSAGSSRRRRRRTASCLWRWRSVERAAAAGGASAGGI